MNNLIIQFDYQVCNNKTFKYARKHTENFYVKNPKQGKNHETSQVQAKYALEIEQLQE